jgi:hypothetical protein
MSSKKKKKKIDQPRDDLPNVSSLYMIIGSL